MFTTWNDDARNDVVKVAFNVDSLDTADNELVNL